MDARTSDRFRPEARVVRLPEWRAEPGAKPQVRFDGRDWRNVHPVLVAALEALRDGADFAGAVERATLVRGEFQPNHVPILLRRWFWDLHKAGCIHIPLEPAPELFDGRYRRVKEIGRGNVGVVHLCRDDQMGRDVVVKHAWGYISPIAKSDAALRAEEEALRAFEHAGIPRWLGSFEREGLLHVVREYVHGEPVAERVARAGPLPAADRLRLVAAAADLVAHMHARGWLFLDPTPGNFIERPDGALSVIDVGLCRRHVDGRALDQARSGSRGYTAPEVLASGGVGTWSDVFSLASLHFFLAAAKAPPHRASDAERAELVQKLDLPPDERALLLAAWSHDPARRPGIDELRRALAACSERLLREHGLGR